MVDYLPPQKITSGHIFWNQMSRTMLGWRLDELFVHPSIITSPSAPPRQPPMSAAPLRVYPRDKCKDCECKGCVNQVVFSVWTYHPPTLKLKLVELENLNHSTYASCFTMETNGRHCFLNKIHRSEDVRKCWRWIFLYVHRMPLALWKEAVHLRDDFGSKQLRRKTSCRCKQKPLRI